MTHRSATVSTAREIIMSKLQEREGGKVLLIGSDINSEESRRHRD